MPLNEKGRVDYTLRVKVTPEAQPVALALIEAKPESLPPGHGLEQAKAYATSKRLNVPFVLSTNGHLFVLYDRFSGLTTPPRPMAEFPTPAELRAAYFDGVPLWKGTVQDDLHGHYRLSTHSLETTAVPEEDSPPADAGQVPDNSEFDR